MTQPLDQQSTTKSTDSNVYGNVYGVIIAIAGLALLFLWIYGRFVGRLYFVLDDFIETQVALMRPLPAVIADSFSGKLAWSGYRPLTYSLRGLLAHLFGLEQMGGYYVVSLGLHLINTLLLFALTRRWWRQTGWAFVAAALFLLLPAHNEAVLYMSASANLIALTLCLLSLVMTTAQDDADNTLRDVAAALLYGLAVLAYEVVLPLPALILALDWGLHGRAISGRRLRRYATLAVAVAAVLALRLWATSGGVTPARADYGLSFAPAHLARGYIIFLGQLVLLHSSAWIYLPLFADVRDWMSPFNPRALASATLTAAVSGMSLWPLARRNTSLARHWPTRTSLFWLGWGVLWLLMLSLAFAALSGRNPENRYTYIPSAGYAVALTAFFAWLHARAQSWRPAAANLMLVPVVVILMIYSYVDTSDVAEWERSGQHMRSLVAGLVAPDNAPPTQAEVLLVGMPGNVGGAYTFTTQESFHAAMQLFFAGQNPHTALDDIAVRAALHKPAAPQTMLYLFDRERNTVHRASAALLCDWELHCSPARVGSVLSQGAQQDAVTYVQLYDPAQSDRGGLGLFFTGSAAEPTPALRSCWAFYNLEQTQIDPRQFNAETLANECRTAALRIFDAELLNAPAAMGQTP